MHVYWAFRFFHFSVSLYERRGPLINLVVSGGLLAIPFNKLLEANAYKNWVARADFFSLIFCLSIAIGKKKWCSLFSERPPQIWCLFLLTATSKQPKFKGTQRIISINYLFGRPLILSDFLKRTVTSKFRDMRKLMSVVFRLIKVSFWVPKKGQLSFSERR